MTLWLLTVLAQPGPGIVGFDSQLVGAVLTVIGAIFIAMGLGWMGWASLTLIRLIVLAARLEPILEVFEYDLGPILRKHPGHRSLTEEEQSVLDRFERNRKTPNLAELEILRKGAEREKDDEHAPADYRMGMAILQGTLRGEIRARDGNWFRKFVWNFYS